MVKIVCSKLSSIVDSHHDIILTKIAVLSNESNVEKAKRPEAPKIPNTIWFPEGTTEYADLISPVLSSLRDSWLDSSSPSSILILLQSTYEIKSTAASNTNKAISLGRHFASKNPILPPEVIDAAKTHDIAHKNWLRVSEDLNSSDADKVHAKEIFKQCRTENRKEKANCYDIEKKE